MATRGRKSAAAMQVVPIGTMERPKPPAKLGRRQKALWRYIVDSLPADYFRASDVPLLEKYCWLSVHCDDLMAAVDKDFSDTKSQTQIYKALTNLSSLATKMRLCPNARIRKDQGVMLAKDRKTRPWDKSQRS